MLCGCDLDTWAIDTADTASSCPTGSLCLAVALTCTYDQLDIVT